MAKQNLAMLLGAVAKNSKVVKDAEGNPLYAMAYINVARGPRDVGDHRVYMKCDNPIIMSRDEDIVRKMETWKKGDMVMVKGVVASRHIMKSSYCTHCKTKNSFPGSFIYINPIYVETCAHCKSDEECLQYLAERREISNQVFVFGRLCRNPKKIIPKQDLVVTQYQIAMNRKFRIKTDPKEMTSDYPWVKSYGENAENDYWKLKVGSEIYIDGCLQARSVQRHAICGQAYDGKGKPMVNEDGSPVIMKDAKGNPLGCGEQYDWQDRAMEIVPYATEYLSDVYTEEEVAARKEERRLQKEREMQMKGLVDLTEGLDDDRNEITNDDIEAGIDTMEKTDA